jgi:hypothetical protein
MSYITLFTAPKPFTNPHIAMIQRNAIQSWLNIDQEVQVFLIGQEQGMAQVAAEFGVNIFECTGNNQTPRWSLISLGENSSSPFCLRKRRYHPVA